MDANESWDSKLDTLKGMGFQDEKKNNVILRGHDGNMDKAIESLKRLGEGGPHFSEPQAVTHPQSGSTPIGTNGAATRFEPRTVTSAAQPVAERTRQDHFPEVTNPFNPFDMHNPTSNVQAPPIELDMQAMHISPQPLFPQNASPWYHNDQTNQTNPFMKNFTPPMSPAPYQYHADPRQSPFPQQHEQQLQQVSQPAMTTLYNNPFLRISQQENLQLPIISNQAQYSPASSSPARETNGSPAPDQWSSNFFQPEQQFFQPHVQQVQYQSPQGSVPRNQPNAALSYQNGEPQFNQLGNPADAWQPLAQIPFAPEANQWYQQQPAQANFRMDKGSILALYNQQTSPPTSATDFEILTSSKQTHSDPSPRPPQRSVTMPASMSSAAQSMNPFSSLVTAPPPPNTGAIPLVGTSKGHVRQESKEFSGTSMTNGRHSPDAFANLSSKFV